MDNDSNKITWVVVLIACISLIGVIAINTLFPMQLASIEDYVTNVFKNTSKATNSNSTSAVASNNSSSTTNTTSSTNNTTDTGSTTTISADDTVTDLNINSTHDYTYAIVSDSDKTVSITGYAGTATSVKIPSTINYNGQIYTVTAIGDKAFANKYKITSVTIPNSITSIGDNAFEVDNIGSVTIPDSVTSIGSGAFYLNGLRSVTLSKNLVTIGSGAFYINYLGSITIPDSVITIGQQAFGNNKFKSVSAPTALQSQIESNSVFLKNSQVFQLSYY